MNFLSSYDFIDTFKKICLDTIDSSKPVSLFFGTVSSTDPFTVSLEQKLSLSSSQLIFCQMSLTEDFSLEVGDTLALLRQQGGQKYLIIDKVVSS